ncbi:MAG: YdcF family protein, partial [Lachnospiraceae bacterium]|nr:YdcF family protein [Lachnospiraceae bacterium]
CRVYGERPSLILTERMGAALLYLDENPDAVCIASGGKGQDEDISEAECIYRYLVENGIEAGRIYIEDQSTSTRENLAFSYAIIQENALPEEIAIVTNEFHECRAGIIADKLGLSYGAISAKTAMWLLPTYYARELFGVLYEWLKFS